MSPGKVVCLKQTCIHHLGQYQTRTEQMEQLFHNNCTIFNWNLFVGRDDCDFHHRFNSSVKMSMFSQSLSSYFSSFLLFLSAQNSKLGPFESTFLGIYMLDGDVHLLLKTNTYALVRQMRIEIIRSLKNVDEHKGDHCKLCGGK